MNVTFAIYLEATDDNEVVWWAEADALPGLSVAAPTLRELRRLIEEAVRMRVGDAEISLELAANLPPSETIEVTIKDAPVDLSGSDAAQVRFLTALAAA